MKYYIVAAAFVIGVGVWLSQKPILEVTPEPLPNPPQRSVITSLNQSRSNENATKKSQEPNASIERLTEEMLQLKNELRALDYPKVMLDKRLSEEDRTIIVKKVLAASALHDKITLLRLKQIEGEVDL
jgi:hypothetical protein